VGVKQQPKTDEPLWEKGPGIQVDMGHVNNKKFLSFIAFAAKSEKTRQFKTKKKETTIT
jgi:hypothetical protein